MSKLRKSARGQTCTFRIPGVCNGDPETTVLCHAPHPEKGMGHKGPDWWAAYGCSSCHDEMDGRTRVWFPPDMPEFPLLETMQNALWCEAIRETQTRMVKAGLIKV